MGEWTKPGTFKSKLKRKKLDTATEPTGRERNGFLLERETTFPVAGERRAHNALETYSVIVFWFSLSKDRLIMSIG